MLHARNTCYQGFSTYGNPSPYEAKVIFEFFGVQVVVKSSPSRQPARHEIPKGASLCDYCTGKCCRYIALPIDEPVTKDDYDSIRWYLTHDDISVFVENGSWYIMIFRECRHLLSDNRCGIYRNRPKICHDYHTDTCEYDSDFVYEKIFETDDQIWEYAEAMLGPEEISVESPSPFRIV